MKPLDFHIQSTTLTQEIPFDLLELADPSISHIESYLKTGTCYLAKNRNKTIGAMVLNEIDSHTLEIKNIAVAPNNQGKGCGKSLLAHATRVGQDAGYEKLMVGTGNSSVGQLAFYQKSGFEISHVLKNYFLDQYPNPILSTASIASIW